MPRTLGERGIELASGFVKSPMVFPAHAYRKFVAVGLIGCAPLLSSNRASAESPPKSRSGQAELLSHQGQVLLDAGHIDAACAKFEASETLENAVGTLLQLGDCHERAGRTASAWHSFLEAQALAHFEKDRDREQIATQRVSALEPKLIRIVLLVPMTSRVPGLTVRLGANTVPARSWGAPIPVDAGVQRVSASATGYGSWSLDIDASRGGGQQFTVNVPALSPNVAEQAVSARRDAYRTAGIVTGSFGLAGIGAGAVFSALSRNPDDAGTCAKGVVQCTPKSTSLVYTDAATVSFALGGALLATGVTLFVLAPGPDNKEKNALRVAARYAGSGGRLQLEGVW